MRRGRPGLAGSAPSGLVAVGVPAANSLSRIFVRIGCRLDGLPSTIPDSMPGSLDCAARELQSPGYSVDTVTNATMPQAVHRLRNSSTTVMRRMLASIKKRGRSFGWRTSSSPKLAYGPGRTCHGGLQAIILRGRKSFFCCDCHIRTIQFASG